MLYRRNTRPWTLFNPSSSAITASGTTSAWDLDLDDGSTNYQIYDNLLLNAGIKLRDGFYRTVKNNILVGGSIYEQVSHANDGDVIQNNITLDGSAYQLTNSNPATAKKV